MKISIIVPIYKSEIHLVRCVNSILNQTYKNIEVILVNDGSPDRSPSICDEFVKKDSRVKVIHKINGGVSSARNAGLNKSTGQYIQFVDSDDYIQHDMCETLINAIKTKNADLIVCGYTLINHDKISSVIYQTNDYENISCLENDFSILYEKFFFNSIWNKLYNKSLIKSLFNEELSLGEDLIFNFEYLKNCKKVSIIENCLYNYIVENNNSLSSRYDPKMFNIISMLCNEAISFSNTYIGESTNKSGIYQVFIMNLLGAIQLLTYNGIQKESDKIIIIKRWLMDENVKKASRYNLKFNLLQKKLYKCVRNERVYTLYLFFKIKKNIAIYLKVGNNE